jgi:hypothetical protein
MVFMINHGTTTAYANYGCRCDECRAANTAYQRDRRSRKAAGLPVRARAANGEMGAHGTYSTYIHHKCRCKECSIANATYQVEYWTRRLEELRPTGFED